MRYSLNRAVLREYRNANRAVTALLAHKATVRDKAGQYRLEYQNVNRAVTDLLAYKASSQDKVGQDRLTLRRSPYTGPTTLYLVSYMVHRKWAAFEQKTSRFGG